MAFGPLQILDLTLPSAVENLALDEALLEEMEEHGGAPVLRFWESPSHFVVLGFGGDSDSDVHLDTCRADGVPVLRRATGGGTVLQGPGCLSYALVLPIAFHPDLANIRSTYTFILQRLAKALHRWNPAVALAGISDLVVDGRKISGNAQRRKRKTVLFHGTILHEMPAGLITRYLKLPKRQPAYRADRCHEDFLSTIPVRPDEIKEAMSEAWKPGRIAETWPSSRMFHSMAQVLSRSSR